MLLLSVKRRETLIWKHYESSEYIDLFLELA